MAKDQKKSGVILSYLLVLVNSFSGFFLTPFLISGLGKAEFGLYQLIGAFASYLAVLDFGLGTTITRYVAKYKAENDKRGEENFLTMSIAVYGLLALGLFTIGLILYFQIDRIFGTSLSPREIETAKTLYVVMLLTLSLSLFDNAFVGIITAYEQFAISNTLKLIRTALRFTALIILLQLGFKSIAIVMTDLVITITSIVVQLIIARVKCKVSFKFYYFDRALFRETMLFSFFIFLQIVVNQINGSVGKFVVGVMLNTSMVAVFAIASQMYLTFSTLSTSISSVYLPSITRLVTQGVTRQALTEYIVVPSRYQLMVLGAALSAFLLFGKEFILLWTDESFAPAWSMTLIMIVPATVALSQNVILSVLSAKNKLAFRTTVNVCIALANILVSIVAIKYYGVIGAAIGVGLTLTLGAVIISNIYYHREAGVDVILFFRLMSRGIVPAMLIAVGIGFLIRLLPTGSWGYLLMKGGLFTLVYGICLWMIGLNQNEKANFTRVAIRCNPRTYLPTSRTKTKTLS